MSASWGSRSKLCPTYPEVLLVPVSVSDADLIKAAEFRSRARYVGMYG